MDLRALRRDVGRSADVEGAKRIGGERCCETPPWNPVTVPSVVKVAAVSDAPQVAWDEPSF